MSEKTDDIAHPTRTSCHLQGLSVDIRYSVAFREITSDFGLLLYLSLFDDEIDERFERFAARASWETGGARSPSDVNIACAASHLELTDALIVYRPRGCSAVVRGGSCTFPLFWRVSASTVFVSTILPLLEGGRFSKVGLASAIAAVCHHGSYEPNAWTDTPLHEWHRVRRGVVTFFETETGATRELVVDPDGYGEAVPQEEEVVECLQEAFSAYSRSQARVVSSILEVSGGYDSTLAGAAARSPSNVMRGISVEFPYYEFRFEAAIQQAVATALSMPRTVVDGTDLFPYAPWDRPPRFDEPAVFVTGIRHAERVASFAMSHGATRIYVGHGGDQLFSTDLDGLEPMAPPPSRAPFSRDVWRAVRQTRLAIWRRRSTGCFIYDARQDVWVKETFGPTLRTPFSDAAVFRAARMWSRWNSMRRRQPDKTILVRALGDLLPRAVTARRGKVAYDGVWMRAYAVHGEHIERTLERSATILEHVGVSPVWMLKQARRLSQWAPVSGREVLAAYAVAAWLVSWGIERVSDVTWH